MLRDYLVLYISQLNHKQASQISKSWTEVLHEEYYPGIFSTK
jgi:hypothetical protein